MNQNKDTKKVIVFEQYKDTDKDGKATNESCWLYDEQLSKCENLSNWIRVDGFLARLPEIYWYFGLDKLTDFGRMHVIDIALELSEVLNGKKLSVAAKEVHDYINDQSQNTRFVYWYAQRHHLTRADAERLPINYIKK